MNKIYEVTGTMDVTVTISTTIKADSVEEAEKLFVESPEIRAKGKDLIIDGYGEFDINPFEVKEV